MRIVLLKSVDLEYDREEFSERSAKRGRRKIHWRLENINKWIYLVANADDRTRITCLLV